MHPLTIRTRREAGRAVVALAGELDISSVDEMRQAALVELDSEGSSGVVFDLEDLDFLDSTGIGCWIDLRNHAETLGKSVELINVPTPVRRTMTIAGLAPLFGVDRTDPV